jgi:hypothetical protein
LASPSITIASRDYTAAQQDTGAAKENQQPTKQLQEKKQERKKHKTDYSENVVLVCQSSQSNRHRLPSTIPAVSSLASRSSFPMHRYKFHVPRIIKSPPSLSPFSAGLIS